MRFQIQTLWLVTFLVAPVSVLQAGGKHLEVMVPLSRQHDFRGKLYHVTERSYELTESGMETLESVKKSEYDQDGNALRIESFDASDRKTSSDVYGYDEGGNWTSLIEEADGSVTNYLVFADPKTKRIAKVHSRSKDTEFITYTEQGFESATLTQTSTGRILEKTTIRRNSSQQEENVLFEEPPGTKTTEFQIQWSDRGFESRSVLVMHDKGGDQMVIQFEYPDVDAQGNWLTQIEKRVLMLKNGDKRTLPTVINKRTLSYHAEADKK